MKSVNFGVVGKIKLNSYHPLCSNTFGQRAIEKYNMHPFTDGSCRREPDLQNPSPSISALCRQDSFATKLWPNDVVVYISLEDENLKNPNYRLVAILKVSKRFDTHHLASCWYRDNNIKTPSNCMITGNDPEIFDKTISKFKKQKDIDRFLSKSQDQQTLIGKRIVNSWNQEYQEKSEKWSKFIVTKPKYNTVKENISPPILSKEDLIGIMERVPNTRTPNNLTADQLRGFCKIAGIEPIITNR